jgi:predicted RNase H-like nuclease (RuvC/YqgF family)
VSPFPTYEQEHFRSSTLDAFNLLLTSFGVFLTTMAGAYGLVVKKRAEAESLVLDARARADAAEAESERIDAEHLAQLHSVQASIVSQMRDLSEQQAFRIDGLELRVSSLTGTVEAQADRIAALEQLINEREREIAELRVQGHAKDRRIEELEAEVVRLTAELCELRGAGR